MEVIHHFHDSQSSNETPENTTDNSSQLLPTPVITNNQHNHPFSLLYFYLLLVIYLTSILQRRPRYQLLTTPLFDSPITLLRMRLILLLMTIVSNPHTVSIFKCVTTWIMSNSWLVTREHLQVVFLSRDPYYVMPIFSKSIIFLLKLLHILIISFQQPAHLHSIS